MTSGVAAGPAPCSLAARSALGVAVNDTVPVNNGSMGSAVSATFSTAMNPLTINTTTFTVKQGVAVVAGTVDYAGVTATFTPTARLAANLPFTATITAGVRDLAGNALTDNYVWTFATSAVADVLPRTAPSEAIVPFSPSILTLDQSGSGQGIVGIALTGQLAGPQGSGSTPVARDQYIAIYAKGLGPVWNQPATGSAALFRPHSYTSTQPTVTIGGVPAPVAFSGLVPGFAGVYQINVLVPSSVNPGSAVSVILTIAGIPSNTVTIAVQ